MFDLDKALAAAYKDALKTLKKKNAAFFEKWQQVMSGQIQPPQWYVDNDMVDYWRNGFLNELARQYHVEQQIMDEINRAGGKASKGIQQASQIEYAHGYQGEVTRIVTEAYKGGFVMTPVIDKRAVQIAVNDAQIMSSFSKVKYRSLGENMQVRRRLQRELGASIAAGESRTKLMQRILNVVGNAQYNAKRTAQTELNRVRNQSLYEADQYIHEAYGLETKRVWHCRFVNSRDGHMETEGQYEDADGGWWVSGEHLKFPGDPSGSAWNVINCHCQTESQLVTDSPAMQALRERNAARRREWLQKNAEHNKDDLNWRRGKQGVENKHPYARNNLNFKDNRVTIEAPIESRNTARGHAQAVSIFGTDLNTRQETILGKLPNFGSSVTLKKNEVNMSDLSALTAKTGDEFTLFTRKSQRMVMRGNPYSCPIDVSQAKRLRADGYRWSGHTHPGNNEFVLFPSDGDQAVLAAFGQKRSVIVNSMGQRYIMEGVEDVGSNEN